MFSPGSAPRAHRLEEQLGQLLSTRLEWKVLQGDRPALDELPILGTDQIDHEGRLKKSPTMRSLLIGPSRGVCVVVVFSIFPPARIDLPAIEAENGPSARFRTSRPDRSGGSPPFR